MENTQNLAPEGLIQPLTVSVSDAAVMLGVGKSTVYSLIHEGELETVKFSHASSPKNIRISTKVLNQFIDKGGLE